MYYFKSLQYTIILINLNKNIFFNYEAIMQVAMLVQIFTKFFFVKKKNQGQDLRLHMLFQMHQLNFLHWLSEK